MSVRDSVVTRVQGRAREQLCDGEQRVERAVFEMHFANGAAVVAHRYSWTRPEWFARLYFDHKVIASSDDAPTLATALLVLADEIYNATGADIREVLRDA